jgi:hypothetical protein
VIGGKAVFKIELVEKTVLLSNFWSHHRLALSLKTLRKGNHVNSVLTTEFFNTLV